MRRTRIALAAAMFSALMAATPAAAYTNGSGKSQEAPGWGHAADNCDELIEKQRDRGNHARGGPKGPTEDGAEAPTNCDHYWQNDGFIGNAD